MDTTIKNSLICTIKYKATWFMALLICMQKYWDIYFKLHRIRSTAGGWKGKTGCWKPNCSEIRPELRFTLLEGDDCQFDMIRDELS